MIVFRYVLSNHLTRFDGVGRRISPASCLVHRIIWASPASWDFTGLSPSCCAIVYCRTARGGATPTWRTYMQESTVWGKIETCGRIICFHFLKNRTCIQTTSGCCAAAVLKVHTSITQSTTDVYFWCINKWDTDSVLKAKAASGLRIWLKSVSHIKINFLVDPSSYNQTANIATNKVINALGFAS